MPPNLKGFKLRWTQTIKRDEEKGSISIYTPWYFKKEMGYGILSVIIMAVMFYLIQGHPWLSMTAFPGVIGATWTGKASGSWDATGQTTWNEAGGPPVAGDTVTTGPFAITCGSATACATLTVSAGGSLNTTASNWSLTTTNACTVSGTLTLNGSTVSCTGGGNYSIEISGTFNGGSGSHTFDAVLINGGSWVATSGNTTIKSASLSGMGIAFTSGTMTHSNGTIIFTYAGTQMLWVTGNVAKTFYNFTINNASCAVSYYAGQSFALTVANNLTITAGSFTTWDGTTSANLTVTGATSVTGSLIPQSSTCTFNGAVTVNNGGTLGGNTAWTCKTADNLTVSAGGVMDFGTGTAHTIWGVSAVSLKTFAGGGTVDMGTATIAIKWMDVTYDVVTGGTGCTVNFTGNMTIDAWTVSAGDTLSCTVAGTTITANAGKIFSIIGTLTLNGSAGSNITVGTFNYTILTAATVDWQYVTFNNGGSGGTGLYFESGTPTITRIDNVTFNSAAGGAFASLISSVVITMSNCTFSGTGADWYRKDVNIWAGARLQLSSCTFTTVGMQATSGWLVSKDHAGVTNDYRFYGVANVNTPSAGYRPGQNDNITVKNADAYSTPFNSILTMNVDLNCQYIVTNASTSIAISTGIQVIANCDFVNNGAIVMTGPSALVARSITGSGTVTINSNSIIQANGAGPIALPLANPIVGNLAYCSINPTVV